MTRSAQSGVPRRSVRWTRATPRQIWAAHPRTPRTHRGRRRMIVLARGGPASTAGGPDRRKPTTSVATFSKWASSLLPGCATRCVCGSRPREIRMPIRHRAAQRVPGAIPQGRRPTEPHLQTQRSSVRPVQGGGTKSRWWSRTNGEFSELRSEMSGQHRRPVPFQSFNSYCDPVQAVWRVAGGEAGLPVTQIPPRGLLGWPGSRD